MKILSWFDAKNPEWWLKQIGESDWRAGQFLHQLLRENRLREAAGPSARVLLLADGSRLASFCTYGEKDDIPETDLKPWLGFVYTFPAYRGRRLAGKLIAKAREIAREEGWDALYISTREQGYYEKYGAEFLAVMKDSEGLDSRVYRLDAYGFAGWETADVPAKTSANGL